MSAFSRIAQEVKEQIKADYLSGMDAPELATKYGFKHARTVYFHLSPLTPLDKATHMQNKASRMAEAIRTEEVVNES